tara:strand:+ start:4076 stop:5563 length:1488 start_codon:yes stop_codon:yes gene_type:complete
MKSKPITSKSKPAPLKQTPPTLGDMKVYDAEGNLLQASDAATSGTEGTPSSTTTVQKKLPSYSEAYKGVDKEKYPTLDSFVDAAEKYKKDNPDKFKSMSTETKVTPGTPGTDGERTTEYKPVLTEAKDADQVDTFLPWERRFAQRTQRAAVRDEKRRGRKGMKDLNKALKAGAITQEQYDKDYTQAQKLALGQGNIAKAQYTNTGRMDAIASQGYQANPSVRTSTDMMRDPKAGQEAGQPVKADASVTMSQEDYENFGKSTPKTSASVQDASSKAGASVPAPKTSDASIIKVDGTSSSADMFKGLESEDYGLMSDRPSTRTPSQPSTKTEQESSNKPSGPIGGKGVETDNLDDLLSVDPPKMNETYGIDIEDSLNKDAIALEEDLASDRTAFMKRGYKMNRTHSPAMMYNKNAPTRKMVSPLNKLTDLSGDGKVTRKDVLIGRGVLDKDGTPLNKFVSDAQRKAVWASKNEKKASATKYKPTAFKMKGFGSKNKK